MTSVVMETVKNQGGRPSTQFASIQTDFIEALYCNNDYTNAELEFFGGDTMRVFNYKNGLDLKGRFGPRKSGGKKVD